MRLYMFRWRYLVNLKDHRWLVEDIILLVCRQTNRRTETCTHWNFTCCQEWADIKRSKVTGLMSLTARQRATEWERDWGQGSKDYLMDSAAHPCQSVSHGSAGGSCLHVDAAPLHQLGLLRWRGRRTVSSPAPNFLHPSDLVLGRWDNRQACMFLWLQTVHGDHSRRHRGWDDKQAVRQSLAAQRVFGHDRHSHLQRRQIAHLWESFRHAISPMRKLPGPQRPACIVASLVMVSSNVSPFLPQAPEMSKSKVRNLVVTVRGEQFSMTETRKVMIKYYPLKSFVQTDKPIYLPGQTGKLTGRSAVWKNPLNPVCFASQCISESSHWTPSWDLQRGWWVPRGCFIACGLDNNVWKPRKSQVKSGKPNKA